MKILQLLTLTLLILPGVVTGATLAGEHADDPVSFTGTWKTIAGGTTPYTVILKQVGDEVSGSYSPGNGKIFDGVVTDRTVAFKWTQDGGYEGTAEFTMDADGKGFTGNSTALKPKQFSVTWNTYKAPAASFAGTWETISSGAYSMDLTIVQKGDKVTGLYPSHSGKIEGTVSGRVLRFKWESDGGSGSGRFVMEESGQAFSGTYNRGDDPDEVDATWNGKRPVPVSSFAGKWNVKVQDRTVVLELKQTGNQVIGDFNTDKKELAFKEGTVDGRTLRLKIIIIGREILGEVVMDEGGKSFKGLINGLPTTGVLAPG